jgi:hypothetical protein
MNLALIKHDGAALNMPEGSIQGILPATPTPEAPELHSIVLSSFQGGAIFYLQDYANDVFDCIGNKDGWAGLETSTGEQNLFLRNSLVYGFDEVNNTPEEKFYRVWINNGSGLESMELCKHTPDNLKIITEAITAKGLA